MKYVATIEGQDYEVEINEDDEIVVDEQILPVDFQAVAEEAVYSLIVNGQSYEAYIDPTEAGWQVLVRGKLYLVDVEDERQRRLRESRGSEIVQTGEFKLKSPMPGLVVDVPVEQGEDVSRGQKLIVLESMKMQNELKAPRDGRVGRVEVRSGDSVEQGQVMITLE